MSARETSAVIKRTAAQLTGKERGRDPRVRRDSYDVDDRRAQVFARIADGTKAGGLGYIDDLVALAREYDLVHRKPGERAPLGAFAIGVLEVAMRKCLDFKSGTFDPAIQTIQTYTGYGRNTVIRALARLKAHKFLFWVRRTEKTGNEGGYGPQRKQATNAYFFALAELPRAVLARWRQLRDRRAKRRAGAAPPSPSTPPRPPVVTNPELAAQLARLANTISNASSQ
jgi:hypothetical protein